MVPPLSSEAGLSIHESSSLYATIGGVKGHGKQERADGVAVGGVELRLSRQMDVSHRWIGQEEILTQLLACWLVVDAKDLPLSPRITGPPGIGKTTLATARLARQANVEMPIAEQIYSVLYEQKPPGKALKELMSRDLRSELS